MIQKYHTEKKKLSSSNDIEVEFHPTEMTVGQTKNAVFIYEGSNNISKDVEILSKYVRIRFLDKEKNRVLLDKQVERGKEYTINIMDNSIDNPDNFLLLDHNGMAIGFKISDGEWGPDMDHKETFRRILWEDTDIECEMMRFLGFYNNSSFSVNDKTTDISEGAIGFDDVCYYSDVNFDSKLAELNCGKRVSVKYYCGRRLSDMNYTYFNFRRLTSGSKKIKEVQNSVFKYCRNIKHFISFLSDAYTDVKFSSEILKYLTKLESIGTVYNWDEYKNGCVINYKYPNRNYGLFFNDILTNKNPDNSEIIVLQDVMNRCLEFIFNKYTANTVKIIGQCFKEHYASNLNYLDIKYTGNEVLKPLNKVKSLVGFSYYLNSFDVGLLKLVPNLEIFCKLCSTASSEFISKRLDISALEWLPNLKEVYDIGYNFKFKDGIFKCNRNLNLIWGDTIGSTDTFTVDVFKNNPNIKSINNIFSGNGTIENINNINILLKSLAKYSNVSNIDDLFLSTKYTEVPEAFYELDKTKISSCNRAFRYAQNLTHLPELWDKSQYPNIVEYSKCFYNCTSADNYNQVPEGWK